MWIIPQHHTQIDRFYDIIDLIKNAHSNNLSTIREDLIIDLKEKGKYQGRQVADITSAANHNIDEPFFYGLIYKLNKEVFISQYGELIYKVWNNYSSRSIVFIYSLFNIQYFHPSKKNCESNLYPFRLLFKILRDKRIENKISVPELYFLYKVDKLELEIEYEDTIKEILKFRKNCINFKDYFKDVTSDLVISASSGQYLVKILSKFNILYSNENNEYHTLLSPSRKDPTKINNNYYSLNPEYFNLIDKLLLKHSPFAKTRKSALPSELASEIFNFIDNEVYSDINETVDLDFSLANEIYEYSINPDKCYDFENKVNEAFNLFYNVNSEVVGGSGEPDFVARFKTNFPSIDNSIIFTGDTKSTKNQLMGINAGRIKQHMRKYDSEYTILITPKYSPATKKDIIGEKIVILSSLALSETVRNFIKYDQKPNYKDFNDIIIENLGTDVSEKFYNKIDEIYGLGIK
jgi:type II restriction enzyme